MQKSKLLKGLATLVVFSSLISTFPMAQAQVAEELLGVSFSREGIHYQVRSGGCTKKDDFVVKQLETHPLQLELVRVRPDSCRAYLPFGKTITFTFDELGFQGGTSFTLRNQLRKVYRFHR